MLIPQKGWGAQYIAAFRLYIRMTQRLLLPGLWRHRSAYLDPENDYVSVPYKVGLINISLFLKILANFVFTQKLLVLLACFWLENTQLVKFFQILSKKEEKCKKMRMFLNFISFHQFTPSSFAKRCIHVRKACMQANSLSTSSGPRKTKVFKAKI